MLTWLFLLCISLPMWGEVDVWGGCFGQSTRWRRRFVCCVYSCAVGTWMKRWERTPDWRSACLSRVSTTPPESPSRSCRPRCKELHYPVRAGKPTLLSARSTTKSVTSRLVVSDGQDHYHYFTQRQSTRLSFWSHLSLYLFVCLFVCLCISINPLTLLRWGIITRPLALNGIT